MKDLYYVMYSFGSVQDYSIVSEDEKKERERLSQETDSDCNEAFYGSWPFGMATDEAVKMALVDIELLTENIGTLYERAGRK